jgi:hypothetical protein
MLHEIRLVRLGTSKAHRPIAFLAIGLVGKRSWRDGGPFHQGQAFWPRGGDARPLFESGTDIGRRQTQKRPRRGDSIRGHQPTWGFLPAAAIMRMEAGSKESTHHSGGSFPSKGPSRDSWGPREGVLPAANQKEALSLNVTQPNMVPILQPAEKWNAFRRLPLGLKAGPNVF